MIEKIELIPFTTMAKARIFVQTQFFTYFLNCGAKYFCHKIIVVEIFSAIHICCQTITTGFFGKAMLPPHNSTSVLDFDWQDRIEHHSHSKLIVKMKKLLSIEIFHCN